MRAAHLLAHTTFVLAVLAIQGAAASANAEKNGQALLDALREADELLAVTLIDGRTANARDETGTTPLMWAAQRCYVDMGSRLLKAGADPNARSAMGLGPLQLAIANRCGDLAVQLLNEGAKVNVARDGGETPLMTAARNGELELMKQLIARGANVNAREEAFHQTALMWSAGYPEQVRLLIKHGADVGARTKVWEISDAIYSTASDALWHHDGEYIRKKGGQNALFFAVQKNDLESARALLDAGVNVNATAADGSTALLLSLYKWRKVPLQYEALSLLPVPPPFDPNLNMANLLLDRGAKVDVTDAAGFTPLHGAVLALVPSKWLRTAQANEQYESKEDAAVGTQEGVALIKRLLELNAHPNAVTRYPTLGPIGVVRLNPAAPPGSSPLHLAALSTNTEVMEALIVRGGDPQRLRQDGHSPLSIAVKVNDLSMVKLLVASGADVKRIYDPSKDAITIGDPTKHVSVPRSKQTLLHIAAAAEAHSVVGFLAEQGAPLHLKNSEGETALALAELREQFKHVSKLEQEAVRASFLNTTPQAVVRQTDTTDALKKALEARPQLTGDPRQKSAQSSR